MDKSPIYQWFENSTKDILAVSQLVVQDFTTFSTISRNKTLAPEQTSELIRIEKDTSRNVTKFLSLLPSLRKEAELNDFSSSLVVIDCLEMVASKVESLLPQICKLLGKVPPKTDDPFEEFEEIFSDTIPALCKDIMKKVSKEKATTSHVPTKVTFSGSVARTFPPVISKTSQTYVADPILETFKSPTLLDTSDIYKNDFFPQSHFNFLGLNSTGTCINVVSVYEDPTPSFPAIECFDLGHTYKALLTHKGGTTRFTIHSAMLAKQKENDIGKSIARFLTHQSQEGLTYVKMADPAFSNALLHIGQSLGSTIPGLKVAVLYIKEGDQTIQQAFANQPPATSPFWKFMGCVGEKIHLKTWPKSRYRGDFGKDGPETDLYTYFTVWKGVNIMFHVAPWLGPEQHRRLIGNDICVLIWYEGITDSSFEPDIVSQLGTVPQIFSVVRPCDEVVQLGFFHRSAIRTYEPHSPPSDYVMDFGTCREYLLTKLLNGFEMAFQYPPLLRLRQEPRIAALTDLATKYIQMIPGSGQHLTFKPLYQPKDEEEEKSEKISKITRRNTVNTRKSLGPLDSQGEERTGRKNPALRKSVGDELFSSESGKYRKDKKISARSVSAGTSPSPRFRSSSPEALSDKNVRIQTMLNATVIAGQSLANDDKIDPFCFISVEGTYKTQTPICNGTAKPKWDTSASMPMKTAKGRNAAFVLQCVDNKTGTDIGTLNIPLSVCLATRVPTWFDLENSSSKGQIQLSFTLGKKTLDFDEPTTPTKLEPVVIPAAAWEKKKLQSLLQITCIQAKSDSKDPIDSFFIISDAEATNPLQTPIISNNATPQWDSKLCFPMKTSTGKNVSSYSLKWMQGETVLGTLTLPLSTCLSTKEPTWFKLENSNSGEVQLACLVQLPKFES